RPRAQAEAGDETGIPFRAEIELPLQYPIGIVTLGRSGCLGDLGIHQDRAAQQAHTGDGRAEYIQLDTAVALLAVDAEAIVLGQGVGPTDLEKAQAGAETVPFALGAQLVLLGFVRWKYLAFVH